MNVVLANFVVYVWFRSNTSFLGVQVGHISGFALAAAG